MRTESAESSSKYLGISVSLSEVHHARSPLPQPHTRFYSSPPRTSSSRRYRQLTDLAVLHSLPLLLPLFPCRFLLPPRIPTPSSGSSPHTAPTQNPSPRMASPARPAAASVSGAFGLPPDARCSYDQPLPRCREVPALRSAPLCSRRALSIPNFLPFPSLGA
jgi:hypothetical protein